MRAALDEFEKSFETLPSTLKGAIGQNIVKALGGIPGPPGPDGGVDGFKTINGALIAFQVKLSNKTISKDTLNAFKVNAMGKKATAGIIVSLKGLTRGARKFLTSPEYYASGKFNVADVTMRDVMRGSASQKISSAIQDLEIDGEDLKKASASLI